jgi:hypothetical protein
MLENDAEKLQYSGRKSFKYEGLALLVTWGITVLLVSMFLATFALMHVEVHDSLIRPMVFLIVSSIFILLITWLLITSRSDLLIDDRGISRAIFGWVWQTIEWRNTKVIRSFPASRGEVRTSRTFAVHPLTKTGLSLTLKGIMVFNERLDGFPELLDLLNKYVRLNNIRVETSTVVYGGDWVAVESL